MIQGFLTFLEFLSLEKYCKTKFDIIWNFENSRFFNLNYIPKNVIKISHIVDLNQNFNVGIAAKTANITLATSDVILKRNLIYNSKSFKIFHGYSLPLKEEDSVNYIQIQNNKINVGYIGNILSKYIDRDLLLNTINNNPNCTFHLVGPNKSSNLSLSSSQEDLFFLEKIKKNENIILYGSRPNEDISQILNLMDILLICYLSKKFSNQLSSPHKVLEYLGSGKTIVATYTDEYKDKQELLEMENESNSFEAIFNKVVNNLSFYNSMEKQQKRIQFAMNNTYEKQIDRIESILNSSI